jgi:hypothetical protein
MTVRFFRLREDGPEVIGTITLQDGVLVADPPDSVALRNVLSDEVWIYPMTDDPPLKLNAIDHPKEFLEGLPKQYGHGSYFWAVAVEN